MSEVTIPAIFFTRQHLLHPFSYRKKDVTISIEDRKVQIIALSILIGLATAIVGGEA